MYSKQQTSCQKYLFPNIYLKELTKIKAHYFLIRFIQPEITFNLISFNSGQKYKYFIVSFIILGYVYSFVMLAISSRTL